MTAGAIVGIAGSRSSLIRQTYLGALTGLESALVTLNGTRIVGLK